MCCLTFCFFRQKTAYEMRISDWSSDVCSSDLRAGRSDEQRCVALIVDFGPGGQDHQRRARRPVGEDAARVPLAARNIGMLGEPGLEGVPFVGKGHRSPGRRRLCRRSEEHTSELQSLMRISYAVFCLKKKKHRQKTNTKNTEKTQIQRMT